MPIHPSYDQGSASSTGRGWLLPRSLEHLSHPYWGSRETGIQIRPPKVDLNEQGKLLQVLPQATPLLPHSGVSTPFLASANKPHTWWEIRGLPTIPALSWPREVAEGRPDPPLCPASTFLPISVALPLIWCDATENRGRLLVSSCLKS